MKLTHANINDAVTKNGAAPPSALDQLRASYKAHLKEHRVVVAAMAANVRSNNAWPADYSLLQEEAHKLKGTGASFGWPGITDAAARLEEALADRGPDASLVAPIADLLEALDAAITDETPLADIADKAPLEKSADHDAQSEEHRPWRRRAGCQPLILAVDDDPAVLTLLKTAFSDQAQVHTVDDGMTALAALRTVRYDLVLLDQAMPHISGLDVLENGQFRFAGIPTPVVMVSAHGEADQIDHMLRQGARAYIAKPIQTRSLIDDIETILDREPPIVLIADDDRLIRELLGHRFQQAGAEVLTAATYADTLAIARRVRPHLLILDRSLPGGDGLDILTELRHESATADMKIIVLSAHGTGSDVVAGYARNADDYFTKPFAPHDLIERSVELLTAPGASL